MSRSSTFNGILEKVYIHKFRKFEEVSIPLGEKITAIVGQNGTMKTTLLGMLAQPFSMNDTDAEKETEMPEEGLPESFFNTKTLTGHKFESKFANKFISDFEKEAPGGHRWTFSFVDKTIADNGEFTLISIPRQSKNTPKGAFRFWNEKSKGAGSGYIQYPVIYLSLKRLSPIGEEKNLKVTNIQLAPDEVEFLARNNQNILILNETFNNTSQLNSSNKKNLATHPNEYSAKTVSAGQDNLGSILTAILSFRRLKRSFPNDYKGGLLFIDEIESTLYPAAQKKLVESLFRFCSDYQLQIIFTTHSQKIVETLSAEQYQYHSKILFLRSSNNNVLCETNLTPEQILAKLELKPLTITHPTNSRLRVYTEDEEARIFLKTLLPRNVSSKLEFIKASIGSKELICLAETRQIPEFINNLIVLDGDVTISKKRKNIIKLPTTLPPDRMLYEYLKSLPEDSAFWPGATNTGSYDKQMCFSNFTNINPQTNKCREDYKKWFQSQSEFWGHFKDLAFKRWLQDHKDEAELFVTEVTKAYNALAKKNGLNCL